jgi:hypothetical protein
MLTNPGDLLKAVRQAGLILLVIIELSADDGAGLDALKSLSLQVILLLALLVKA